MYVRGCVFSNGFQDIKNQWIYSFASVFLFYLISVNCLPYSFQIAFNTLACKHTMKAMNSLCAEAHCDHLSIFVDFLCYWIQWNEIKWKYFCIRRFSLASDRCSQRMWWLRNDRDNKQNKTNIHQQQQHNLVGYIENQIESVLVQIRNSVEYMNRAQATNWTNKDTHFKSLNCINILLSPFSYTIR